MPTPTTTQGIVNQICAAESVYQTAMQKRTVALARLRGMNVAFGDIKSRLLKEARVEQFYGSEEELEQAKKDKRQWYIQLFQFIDWVYRTYSNYDVPFKKEKDILKAGLKGQKVIKTNDGTLNEKRVEKILDKPENIKALGIGLESKGIILCHRTLTTQEAEVILGDDENIDLLLQMLSERGLIPVNLAA